MESFAFYEFPDLTSEKSVPKTCSRRTDEGPAIYFRAFIVKEPLLWIALGAVDFVCSRLGRVAQICAQYISLYK